MLQLKRKAREAGETEAGVTLATGNDSGDESDDEHDEEAWMGQHDQQSNGHPGVPYEGGLTSSDEDEQGVRVLQQAVPSKAGQAAYFGMQKRNNESAAAKEYEGLSLSEQETLALKLIKK